MCSRGRSFSILLMLCLVVTGCTEIVNGTSSRVPPSYRDVMPGMPATGGPNGLKAGAPIQPRVVQGITQNEDERQKKTDELALAAIEDIEYFWREKLPKYFKQAETFQPVKTLYSYDAASPDAYACGTSMYREPNAMYCPREDAIAWDRGVLMPLLDEQFPPIAIVVVFAHEYGHRIQSLARLVDRADPTIVFEQQADCFAGFFVHDLVAKGTKHFQLNSSNGLNTLLAAMLALRDGTMSALRPDYAEGEHGSGFDRVSAFQMGFTGGADSCAKITKEEIDTRRKGLPIIPELRMTEAGIPVDRINIESGVIPSIEIFFRDLIKTMPKVEYRGVDRNCPNQKVEADPKKAPPVLYCEATNTVSMDIPALAEIGKPTVEENFPLKYSGDLSAFSIISSRFALAYLKELGLPRTGYGAGLASACLSGAWMRSIVGESGVDPYAKKPILLVPGDLDKATSELLQHGYIAQDINGLAAPSALTRFNALRVGAIGPREVCVQQYPPRA